MLPLICFDVEFAALYSMLTNLEVLYSFKKLSKQ